MTDSTASTDNDSADGIPERLEHSRQRELVQGLLQAVADRVHAEETLADGQAGRSETEDRGYEEACRALEQKRDAARATIIRQYDLVRDETLSQIDAEISATQIEYDDRVAELQQKSEGDREQIEKERDEARWMVQAVLDEPRDGMRNNWLRPEPGPIQPRTSVRKWSQHRQSAAVQCRRARCTVRLGSGPGPVQWSGARRVAWP